MAKRKNSIQKQQNHSRSPVESTPKEPQEQQSTQYQLRSELPSVWFDSLRLSVRTDNEEEKSKLAILSFFYDLSTSDGVLKIENARMMCSAAQAKKITELMCRMLDYYPKPSKSDEK